ncbi:MAG: hypothetical protein K0R18_2753 [Bacillales bacterium]|jgi:hypothetical protein|nr:hypothetical protein [Bacillales bacterium]
MVGVIIIISSLILGRIVFKITQKMIITLSSIVLYAVLLFFIGMGLGNLFYFFALLPIIIGIILIVRKKL